MVEGVEGVVGYRDAGEWMHGCRAGTLGCKPLSQLPSPSSSPELALEGIHLSAHGLITFSGLI